MMIIDLRSDTVTKPTADMRRAMAEAEVGDDVYGDDPTVNELQDIAADMFNKEAALYVPSGTMGNQIAIMAHTRRGDEVICEQDSHVFNYEAGAMAVLSGVQPRTVAGDRGFITRDVLKAALRGSDQHYAPTTLVCLENTHNRWGGTVMRVEEIDDVCSLAHEHGLKVHMDGARVFNAAVYLGVPVDRLTKNADSVMVCLSKGLASPVGSMLVGSKEFIARAHKNRKIVGGGMRQVGVLACCGLISLTKMVDRLADDHENANLLAEKLNALEHLQVNMELVQTNIIMVDIVSDHISANDLSEKMGQAGVLNNAVGRKRVRLVTHNDVDRDDILEAYRRIEGIIEEWQ